MFGGTPFLSKVAGTRHFATQEYFPKYVHKGVQHVQDGLSLQWACEFPQVPTTGFKTTCSE